MAHPLEARWEACESYVNNLLAHLDNISEEDLKGKMRALIEIVGQMQVEIEELQRRTAPRLDPPEYTRTELEGR